MEDNKDNFNNLSAKKNSDGDDDKNDFGKNKEKEKNIISNNNFDKRKLLLQPNIYKETPLVGLLSSTPQSAKLNNQDIFTMQDLDGNNLTLSKPVLRNSDHISIDMKNDESYSILRDCNLYKSKSIDLHRREKLFDSEITYSSIERQESEHSSNDSEKSLLNLPRPSHRLTFTQEIANQIRKGVTFTTNVVGETVGVSELIGVPDAPHLSNAVLDLATVAQKVRQDQENPNLNLPRYDAKTGKTLRPSLSRPDLVYPFLKSDKLKEFCDVEYSVTSEIPKLELVSKAYIHLFQLSQPISQLNQLKIMSFNVGLLEYRLGGITWYCNPPFTKRRLQHLALALREVDCDLIALQEVYQEWQSDYLLEALRIKYPFVGRRSSGSLISLHNGLLTLSRFPIINTAYYPFKSVTLIERIFGSKGILETTVDIPTVGPVTIVNIHLASGAVDPESSALEALRNEEIEEVLEVCDRAVARGEIPIIIGDLNAAPNLCPSNYRNLCEKGFQDAFLAARKGERIADPQREVQELDKVWEDCRNLKIKTYRKRRRIKSKLMRDKKTPCPQRRSLRIRNFFRRKCYSEENLHPVKSRPELRVSSDVLTYDTDRSRLKFSSRIKFNDRPREIVKVRSGDSVLKTDSLMFKTDSIALKTNSDNTPGDSTIRRKLANKFSNYSFNELAHKASQFFNNALRQSTYKNLSRKGDPFCTMDFTWDPKNPLNAIGPHADCHGSRCDHLFLPPKSCAKGLVHFRPIKADILFDEPLVAIRSSWCGMGGRISLLTLSDHYAIRIVLQRVSDLHA